MEKLRRDLGLFRFAAFFAALLLACFSVTAQSKNLIRVAGESVINGDQIDLGMIARINADQIRGERMRNITLGYAPAIGSTRELQRPQIVMAIKAAGFEDGEFLLETPAKILVRRASQNVPSILLRDAVEKVIVSRFSSPTVKTEILHIDVPSELIVPVGVVDVRASIAGVRSFLERFMVPVEVRIDGKIVKSFSATAEVASYSDVLVAATDLAIDKKLASTDVKLQRVRLEKPLTSYLRDPLVLRGVQMIKPLEAGKPLSSDLYTASIVIKLGDTVRIQAVGGRIKVTATGEAKANGRIGDRISVKNTRSGVILQAMVIDAGLVKISI